MKITHIISYLVTLFLGVSIAATATENTQSESKTALRTNGEIQAQAPARILVVTYSKTGNTRAVAQEIIRRYDADAVFIKAPEYENETRSAGDDAWDEVRTAVIEPRSLDMSQYDLVFLGSPIWWYRPAVPLWAFVESNNFTGRNVVLFNTFNSRFKDKYISEFTKLLEAQGGQLVDHLYVRRGRIIWQLSREELLAEFNRVLDDKKEALERYIATPN